MTLQEVLLTVEDPRSRHGLRHPLPDVLLMCLMAMMSGYQGYREIGRFLERNRQELQQAFRLLHKVPTYVTIRQVLQSVDFDKLCAAFNRWAAQYAPMCKGDTKAVDGKAIGCTTSSPQEAYQNFVSVVSVFSAQRGVVLHSGRVENRKGSEIPTVQALIRALDVKGEVFTLDALHCQKKR